MISPEQALFYKTTVNENLTDDEELVYEEKVRKNIKNKPQLDDFKQIESKGIYNEIDIERDKRKILAIKNKFKKDATQRSEILEAVLTEQIELSNWLGDNSSTVETTKYDDYINHTDFIVEFPNDKNINRLAIDVTVSNDTNTLDEKYEYIKNQLDNNKGADIKYFQSEFNQDEKGPLSDIPRVVIAMDQENIQKLSHVIAKILKKEISKKELACNPLQLEILEDIISQLKEQLTYTTNKFGPNNKSRINKNINSLIEDLENIFQHKKSSPQIEKSSSGAINVIPIKPRIY